MDYRDFQDALEIVRRCRQEVFGEDDYAYQILLRVTVRMQAAAVAWEKAAFAA